MCGRKCAKKIVRGPACHVLSLTTKRPPPSSQKIDRDRKEERMRQTINYTVHMNGKIRDYWSIRHSSGDIEVDLIELCPKILCTITLL